MWMEILLGASLCSNIILWLGVLGMATKLEKQIETHNNFVRHNEVEIWPRVNKMIADVSYLRDRDEFFHGSDEEMPGDFGGPGDGTPTAH